jgi:hypothetical protein
MVKVKRSSQGRWRWRWRKKTREQPGEKKLGGPCFGTPTSPVQVEVHVGIANKRQPEYSVYCS